MRTRSRQSQIARNIAVILFHNPEKIRQLEQVKAICSHLTSDDGVCVDVEIYGGGVARYLIHGTRCGMTVTANTLTNEIMRKPRGAQPVFTSWVSMNTSDVFEVLESIQSLHQRIQ